MSNRNKDKVFETYEKIADWYDKHRSRDLFERSYLDMVISRMRPGSKVLDLGCGTGQPIAEYFIANGFQVTGIDGSKAQIEMAKARVPAMKSFVADMRQLELHEKFDCIIAWHSFFHLPKDDQREMFMIFENHINSGGVLLFTSGPDEGEVWSDNGGEQLYHASLSATEYNKLLNDHHFNVITHNIEDEDCGGATVWMAQHN